MLVIAHLLPLASMMDEADPAFTTVSSEDGPVGAGVGVGVAVGAAGNGLVAVPASGAHEAFGFVSPHQRSLAFSCQIVPFT